MTNQPHRIDDVENLGPQDQVIIEQISKILEENDALGRFGLTLLHSHFDLASDEVLVEKVDADARTLTIRPQKQSDLEAEANPLATSWRLTRDGELVDVLYCFRPKGSNIHMR
jgi:hypothetical protein